MNWLTNVAIFLGRKKFEEFAQGNPQLPDDALAVANTLDTYALVNTAIQKLALMNIHEQVVPFFGLVRDSQVRGTSAITIERLCTAVEIRIEGDPPVSNPLIVQINVQGTLQAQQFTVGAGGNYAMVTVNSGGLVIPANDYAAVQITSGNQASDVVVTLKSQLRIL